MVKCGLHVLARQRPVLVARERGNDDGLETLVDPWVRSDVPAQEMRQQRTRKIGGATPCIAPCHPGWTVSNEVRQRAQLTVLIDGHMRLAALVSESRVSGHGRLPFLAADDRGRLVFVRCGLGSARTEAGFEVFVRERAAGVSAMPRRLAIHARSSGCQL